LPDERDSWTAARLLPTFGIRGQEEQEKRATSILLAVMHAVPEFGHALLHELGAPKSPRIDTYTEVRFKGAEKTAIPDGAIVCEWGQKRWTCLVEVKTAGASLQMTQVESYLETARVHTYDGVLTISNDITDKCDQSPLPIDGRKTKKAKLWHLSWWQIITEAIVQYRHRGIADPDQAWILGELIAYLDSSASGAGGFEDMGANWVAVRRGAPDRALRANDPAVRDVAMHWDQLVEYLCLGLTQDLGQRVVPQRSRKQDQRTRIDGSSKRLAVDGVIESAIRVPNAAGILTVRADLRARKTSTAVRLQAPQEGKATTRLSWLLRELPETRPDLLVSAHYPNARQPITATLGEAREDRTKLLHPTDPKRTPREFTVALVRPMGQGRGRGDGSFVSETRSQLLDFYRHAVQNLRPWPPKAPRLPEPPESVSDEPAPDPPPFGNDERAFGDASVPEIASSA
jgi:hypothetical protein